MEKKILFGKMDELVLFEKVDEIKELEALKGAFDSERLRAILNVQPPETMDEEMYDEIAEEVMLQEKVRTVIFNKAKELGLDIKEFIIYTHGDKTIMGVDRELMKEIEKALREKGTSGIGGIELIPSRLWLVL